MSDAPNTSADTAKAATATDDQPSFDQLRRMSQSADNKAKLERTAFLESLSRGDKTNHQGNR
ncbi:hypothetical protein PYCC9005_004324 [Savitreella phatthalungensis]